MEKAVTKDRKPSPSDELKEEIWVPGLAPEASPTQTVLDLASLLGVLEGLELVVSCHLSVDAGDDQTC